MDEINYINCLQGSFAFLDWFQSILCIPFEGKMKMRDGHCHWCQHAVIEIAGGICPQQVLQIIANICLYVHMYVWILFKFAWTCKQFVTVWVCMWDYFHLFVFRICFYEGAICINTHTLLVCLFTFCLSFSLCSSRLHARSPLLNIQPNANRTSECMSVCVCSSPPNQNERPS